MGVRLAGWTALSWRERRKLVVCALGLAIVHASLALYGYARTRSMIEKLTQHANTRDADDVDIVDAQATAELASIAGRHGLLSATCLRQSLLLYGWLRFRGLGPTLQLGVTKQATAVEFGAHAWVELRGVSLLQSDAGHRAFVSHVR